MKPKHEIPSKFDIMKTHSFNFIQNEMVNSDLLHEKNVGKINTDFYKRGHRSTEESSVSKDQNNLSESNIMEDNFSRTDGAITEKSETSILTTSRTDYCGSSPKRYTTKCHIKLVPVPIWYTESVFLNIGSTRRRYEEKIYIKNKPRPCKWSESMYTEVKTMPKNIMSEICIPVEDSNVHYMSLETQQIAAAN